MCKTYEPNSIAFVFFVERSCLDPGGVHFMTPNLTNISSELAMYFVHLVFKGRRLCKLLSRIILLKFTKISKSVP